MKRWFTVYFKNGAPIAGSWSFGPWRSIERMRRAMNSWRDDPCVDRVIATEQCPPNAVEVTTPVEGMDDADTQDTPSKRPAPAKRPPKERPPAVVQERPGQFLWRGVWRKWDGPYRVVKR